MSGGASRRFRAVFHAEALAGIPVEAITGIPAKAITVSPAEAGIHALVEQHGSPLPRG
jgi:hypothetical protein